MAKKTHRMPAATKPVKKSKGKPAKAAKKAKARKPGPRSQPLPGMEQVRNVRLDHLCESISQGREQSNRLVTEEKSDKQAALREMHDRGITAYRHSGVELVRVPGEEKLRVRTSKEDASDMTVDVLDGEDDGGRDNTDEIDEPGEAAEG